MKRLLLCLNLLLSFTAPLLHAQTPFTYQGKLENAGAPFTGTVHIRLGLFSVPSSGAAIRTEVIPNVSVTNGIFTVTPATFTAADFPGAARYLNIEVSGDAGGFYTALTPRQQITWTPYAMTAISAASVTGNVAAAQLTGTLNPSLLGTGSIGGTVTFNPATGAPFSVGANVNLVTNLNADRLDGLTSGDFLRTAGGTLTGDLNVFSPAEVNFGNVVRQMLNLYNADYGIGVQSGTLYQRSGSRFSWFTGGSPSDTENNPGTGGVTLATMTSSGLHLRPGQGNSGAQIAIGDMSGTLPYISLREPAGEDDLLEIAARKVRMVTRNSGTPSLTFGATGGQHLVLFENATDTYGIGVQTGTQYFRTGDQFAWYKDGAHSDTAFSSGGGSTLMTLGSTGTLTVKGSENGINVFNRNNSAQEWAMYSRNSGGIGELAFWNNGSGDSVTIAPGGLLSVKGSSNGYYMANRNNPAQQWAMYSRDSFGTGQLAFWSGDGGDAAALSPNGDFYLVGQLSTSVLTIRGGADVAEPFETTRPHELEPGTVVIIDEENPGKLKRSDGAYDTRVAGIISGAGGVKPGLRLQQDGVLEGDHHVALSGRVYVKADASFGKIKPGDLLTTSSNAGHAMKVKDHDKAQGAILGKAMTRLDKGAGLVLVLVTLQ